MNKQNPLILIVEDDKEMALLNARMLKRCGYNVFTVNTAAEARSFVRGTAPDLFVLDIILPDGDGLALCEEFRKNTDAPILFLTGKKAIRDKITGLNAGGDYYLTKPYSMDEFLAVSERLLQRAEQEKKKIAEASVAVITRGILTLQLLQRAALVNGIDAGLTPKEFAVLQLLVQNEDIALTGEEIYENVWGANANDDTGTVRKHISRLKKKLGEEETDSFYIFYVFGKGYIFTSS